MQNSFNTWKTNGTYQISKNLPQENTEGIKEEDKTRTRGITNSNERMQEQEDTRYL